MNGITLFRVQYLLEKKNSEKHPEWDGKKPSFSAQTPHSQPNIVKLLIKNITLITQYIKIQT